MSEIAAILVVAGFVVQTGTNVAVVMYLRHLKCDLLEDRARIIGLEQSVYGLPRSAGRVVPGGG